MVQKPDDMSFREVQHKIDGEVAVDVDVDAVGDAAAAAADADADVDARSEQASWESKMQNWDRIAAGMAIEQTTEENEE
jgi:hypothetical protein